MSLYELPNEVLEMIFYHSDNKLNISVTCSRFYDIIAASPELMDGICLFFEKFGYVCRQYGKKNLYPPVTQEKADELVQKMLEPLMLSKRRYSHAYIHDYYCTEILKVVEKHSSTITNLSISAQPGDVLMDHSSFSDVMVALSDSLQLLRINCNAIHLNPNKLIYALELPILKGVEMIAAESLGVLQILMKSRIKNLRITTVEDFPYTVDNIKYLVDFLSVQDDLKVK